MISSEDVAHGKPAPDCFLLGAKRLGQAPENCLVFEDATAGIEAAEAAGMSVAIVTAMHRHALDSLHPTIAGYETLTVRLDDKAGLVLADAHANEPAPSEA
jgi:sugar-phosphatase